MKKTENKRVNLKIFKFICGLAIFSLSISWSPVYAGKNNNPGLYRVLKTLKTRTSSAVARLTGGRLFSSEQTANQGHRLVGGQKVQVQEASVSKVRSIVNNEKGVVSNKKISGISEMDLQRVNEVLQILEQKGEVQFLRTSMSDISLSLWVSSKIMDTLKTKGLSESEAKIQLLKKYLAHEQETLNAEQVRLTISMQRGACSNQDISDISEVDLQTTTRILHQLTEKKEVKLLRTGMGEIVPSIWVSLDLVRARAINDGIGESEAENLFLKEYLSPTQEAVTVKQEKDTTADQEDAVIQTQPQEGEVTAPQPETATSPTTARQEETATAPQPETATSPTTARQEEAATAPKPETATSPTTARQEEATTAPQPETATSPTTARQEEAITAPVRPQEAESKPTRAQVKNFVQDLVAQNPQSLTDVNMVESSIKQQFPSVSDHILSTVLHQAQVKQVKDLISNLQKDFITIAHISRYFPSFSANIIEEALKDFTHETKPVLLLMADIIDFSQLSHEFRNRRIRWALETTYVRVDFLKKENINQNPDFETLMFFYRIQAEQDIKNVVKAFTEKQGETPHLGFTLFDLEIYIKEHFHDLHVDKTLLVNLSVNIIDEVLVDLTKSKELLVFSRSDDLPDVYISKELFARKKLNADKFIIFYEEGRILTWSDVQEVKDFTQRQADFITHSEIAQHFLSTFKEEKIQSVIKYLEANGDLFVVRDSPLVYVSQTFLTEKGLKVKEARALERQKRDQKKEQGELPLDTPVQTDAKGEKPLKVLTPHLSSRTGVKASQTDLKDGETRLQSFGLLDTLSLESEQIGFIVKNLSGLINRFPKGEVSEATFIKFGEVIDYYTGLGEALLDLVENTGGLSLLPRDGIALVSRIVSFKSYDFHTAEDIDSLENIAAEQTIQVIYALIANGRSKPGESLNPASKQLDIWFDNWKRSNQQTTVSQSEAVSSRVGSTERGDSKSSQIRTLLKIRS